MILNKVIICFWAKKMSKEKIKIKEYDQLNAVFLLSLLGYNRALQLKKVNIEAGIDFGFIPALIEGLEKIGAKKEVIELYLYSLEFEDMLSFFPKKFNSELLKNEQEIVQLLNNIKIKPGKLWINHLNLLTKSELENEEAVQVNQMIKIRILALIDKYELGEIVQSRLYCKIKYLLNKLVFSETYSKEYRSHTESYIRNKNIDKFVFNIKVFLSKIEGFVDKYDGEFQSEHFEVCNDEDGITSFSS